MEGSPESEKVRGKRRKRKVSACSPRLCKNMSIFKTTYKKRRSLKIKQIAERYVSSFLLDSYDEQINELEDINCEENRQSVVNIFEQTIDLCESDSVNESSNSNLVPVPSVEVEPSNESVIDLSPDIPEPSEVIDLTGPLQPVQLDGDTADHPEPTVIDLSADESKEGSDLKPENDEVCVVATYSKQSRVKSKYHRAKSPDKWRRNFQNLIYCTTKLKRKYMKKQFLWDNRNSSQLKMTSFEHTESSHMAKVARVGGNIYVNSPVILPSSGLRPIIIDGSNVAFVHSNSNFCCKRLEICINYFKERGHKVTAFVPQFRINNYKSDDPQLLRKLERQGDVVLTPSKRVDGKNIVPYDDRFIVQTAVLKGGVIVTRDNYNDLLRENPAWSETIKYRTLAFTWVDDVLMFPKDPLGEFGPSLEEFLRFH